jgi:8-oxo-dGTP pyrophosphatase MutT (NUDIX family)
MLQRTNSVGVLLYDGNKVLLVKHTEKARHKTGVYGFPAGRVDEGKTELEMAVIELEEETGLITSEQYLILLPEERRKTLNMKNGPEDFIFNVYHCTKYWGELRNSDKTIPEFVDIDKLDNLLLISEDVNEIARKYYNKPFVK